MSLNCREIEELITEWDLNGAYLQKIRAVTWESFLFKFYKPGNPINLLVSLDKNQRIHRVKKKTALLGKPHTFVEYLNATLKGGRVTEIKQVDYNRIIEINIINQEIKYHLIIRLWGGFSNILVTDEDYKILHLHRNSPKKSELPGNIYHFPEKGGNGDKFDLKDHSFETYNQYIEERYKRSCNEEETQKTQEREELFKAKRLKEIERQLKGFRKREVEYQNADKYKLYGDLLLSNIYRIKKGDTTITVRDYTTDMDITIPLDPAINPDGHNQYYYKKHKKALSGLEEVKRQIERLEKELDDISNGVITWNYPQDLVKTKDIPNRPGLYYTSGEWEFLVGRSAKENEALLRHWVKGNDMWLHIRDYPGAYVFIRSNKRKTIPLEILIDAANLALHYSKIKEGVTGDVRYTQVKYLRRVKKGKPGQVIPTQDKNLCVKLDKQRLNALYSSV